MYRWHDSNSPILRQFHISTLDQHLTIFDDHEYSRRVHLLDPRQRKDHLPAIPGHIVRLTWIPLKVYRLQILQVC